MTRTKCNYGIKCGEDHPRAKLSNHEVELLRRLHDGGMTQRELAIKFEISPAQVNNLVNYRQR